MDSAEVSNAGGDYQGEKPDKRKSMIDFKEQSYILPGFHVTVIFSLSIEILIKLKLVERFFFLWTGKCF